MTCDELKERRTALGLTQAALADALKVRPQHLGRWESGQSIITDQRADWLERELSRLERAKTHIPSPPVGR
jgi:transcriptional regulator with XRE-family HTH domain